jgi:hypothetical protein
MALNAQDMISTPADRATALASAHRLCDCHPTTSRLTVVRMPPMALVANLFAVPLKHPLGAPKRDQAAVVRLEPLPREQLRAVVIPPEELCRALE